MLRPVRLTLLACCIGGGLFLPIVAAVAGTGPFDLELPSRAVPDRVALNRGLAPNAKQTFAQLDGPGCIKHLFVVLKHPKHSVMANRKIVMRIFFDDSDVPHVEAPVGDFFGAMHGQDWYDLNCQFLSIKAWSGLNSYFQMPFARNARIEFETGPESNCVYLMVDWHRYPDQQMTEPRRFCARWRRECPTERYGQDFLMVDADGPGDLVGFVYGVRLIDNVDRWSHGGSDNIYIDGEGRYPAFLRGIGGEDTFGSGYGGALHPPETHLYAAMPYYVHEDVGEARPAQRLVGYRFFVKDRIQFERSLHMRFGCMQNDICSTVYWYQEAPPRPFTRMPSFDKLLPGTELKRGQMDLPLPDAGAWLVECPLDEKPLEAVSRQADVEGWIERPSYHGFVDFNHVARPHHRGVGVHYSGKTALARCTLVSARDTKATLQFAWDDDLVIRVNGATPIELGHFDAFRHKTVDVKLHRGKNRLVVALSNSRGTNHGGWVFALKATDDVGRVLKPVAE